MLEFLIVVFVTTIAPTLLVVGVGMNICLWAELANRMSGGEPNRIDYLDPPEVEGPTVWITIDEAAKYFDWE